MIVSGMYIQEGLAQRIKIFGYDTPVMFMSYVGALKSWIYTPIFALWKPSPATLRVPVILISALTIWIFYRWLLRIASRRAALIGCVLLSTDTIFLMTSYFDWGPVVLQHFLSVSGAFFVVRFHQTRQLWFLAAGFFQFGLGMWDKAVFIWILCGMAVAAVVVFPKEVWRCLRPSSLAVATLSFCLGSAPLIFYNVSFPLETFRSTATYSTNQFPEKCRNVAGALSGQALFGYLTRFDPAGHPRRGQSAIEQVSIRLSEIAGHPVSGFLGYALMVALLLTPFLWSTPVRRLHIFSHRDARCLATNAVHQGRRRLPAPRCSGLAVSSPSGGYRVRRSLKVPGAYRRSTTGSCRFVPGRDQCVGHERILFLTGSQWGRRRLDRRDLSALRLSEKIQASRCLHQRLGHFQRRPTVNRGTAPVASWQRSAE